MKRILIALVMLVVMCPWLVAQTDPPKFVAAGIGYFGTAKPQIQGWGAVAIPISTSILSFTDYDVSSIKLSQTVQVPGECQGGVCGVPIPVLPMIQYSMRTGIAVKTFMLSDKVTVWEFANAGIAANGTNTVGSFGGGGFVDVALGKGWGALFIIEITRAAINGTEFVPRIGIRKKF